MAMQQNSPAGLSGAPASTVDPAEIAKFSKLSDEWWDPNGKMAPLHKINPLRLTYIRDAACRKFERNVKSLNCLSGLRILDIGCGAGLLCEPFTRLGAQVIGVDPSATNIAAAKLHADKAQLSIDYRCTTVEQMDVRERFDIVLAMEVIEHVTDVGVFLNRCAAMLKPGGLMVISTLNRNWKSFALAIVGAEYVLRWLPRGTHQWDKFVTPDELAHHLENNKLAITEQAGVVYSPFADRWSISSDMDVNYMVVADAILTVDRAQPHRHGSRNFSPANPRSPHAQHCHALDSLHHRRGAGPGRAQRDAAAVDGTARHLGRDQYPLSVRLSVLADLLCRRDRGDRRRRAVADASVLAVAAARRAQPDRRHRHDAARHERPFVPGDDGLSEDRGDPDRDLRFCLSRRSPDPIEGDRDPDRDRRCRHCRAAAGRCEGICGSEADAAG